MGPARRYGDEFEIWSIISVRSTRGGLYNTKLQVQLILASRRKLVVFVLFPLLAVCVVCQPHPLPAFQSGCCAKFHATSTRAFLLEDSPFSSSSSFRLPWAAESATFNLARRSNMASRRAYSSSTLLSVSSSFSIRSLRSSCPSSSLLCRYKRCFTRRAQSLYSCSCSLLGRAPVFSSILGLTASGSFDIRSISTSRWNCLGAIFVLSRSSSSAV